ncbi:MAG: phosphoglycerate dehydrogenase [Opitutales bacterium]
MTQKIIVADKISPVGVDFLNKQEGLDIVEAYGSSPEKILKLARDAHAFIVRSETKITAEVIAAAPNLKAVGRAGVGTDNIDIEAATERGVVVMNTPGGNTNATAELTFTHMLCGTRPIAQANASMKAGNWDRKVFAGSELYGKTLAVLGLGRIGREVARRAQTSGMTVLAYDPYLTESQARALDVEMVDLDGAFSRCDYLTVHMPMTDATHHMVDDAAFGKMKDGVRVFNCARGGIIKESALIAALESGKVAAAGLDVYEDEPLAEDSPLRKFDNVVLTPHLGASTREAQESVGIEIAEVVTRLLQEGIIANAVNMPSVDAKTLAILRPYLTLGQKLGSVIQQISPDQVEKLRITYWGKIVDLDAKPLTRAIQKGYMMRIAGDSVNDVNASKKIQELGIHGETIKSSDEADYTELIRIEAFSKDGTVNTVAGTLLGKQQAPRIVEIDNRELEITPVGTLLVLQNKDTPGIVGFLGTLMGKDGVNIANMSLNRAGEGDNATAFSVYELDSTPSAEAMKAIGENPNILRARLVQV